MYQGVPIGGYTKMVENMLTGVEVRLGVDYLSNKKYYDALAQRVIFTGAIDAYFNYSLGSLEYRSVRFENELLDIPVFHDDQHGTAIVVLAGIINALKLVHKDKEKCRVVVNGAGSAGIAITKMLLNYGFANIIMCDRQGILHKDDNSLNWMQKEMLKLTNLQNEKGSLADAMKHADIFVGVSAPGIVSEEMVSSMAQDSILFTMANPVPEIMPDLAKKAGARIVGTGRSDFPNQVNNVMAFPGIFKGALEGRASQITEEMKVAAAIAIAGLVSEDELHDENIMPQAFDERLASVVSAAVKAHIR
jgi:malate dehydrogenase (oxaloacetate-decarboxylating)